MKRVERIQDRKQTTQGATVTLSYLVHFACGELPEWVTLEDLVIQCGFEHASGKVFLYDLEHRIVKVPNRVIGKSKFFLFLCCKSDGKLLTTYSL
jgi:hypothetical protein